MKELEKVKRISIASTLFILAVLIGLLTFKRPQNNFTVSSKTTLEEITNTDYVVSKNDIDEDNMVLIDVRSPYDYDKGYIANAINIPTTDVLNEENKSLFETYLEANKTIVLYGNSPEEANLPFMLLKQLGFNNTKILNVSLSYFQNALITSATDIENPVADIKAFIKASAEKSVSNIN